MYLRATYSPPKSATALRGFTQELMSSMAASSNVISPALPGPSSPPCASSARTWRLWRLGAPRVRPSHWDPSHCLGGASELPPKSPISPRLTFDHTGMDALDAHTASLQAWGAGAEPAGGASAGKGVGQGMGAKGGMGMGQATGKKKPAAAKKKKKR